MVIAVYSAADRAASLEEQQHELSAMRAPAPRFQDTLIGGSDSHASRYRAMEAALAGVKNIATLLSDQRYHC